MAMSPLTASFPWLASYGGGSPTLDGPGDQPYTRTPEWQAQNGAADKAMIDAQRAARPPVPSATFNLTPALVAGMPLDAATFLDRVNTKLGGLYPTRSHRPVQDTVLYVLQNALIGGGMAQAAARALTEQIAGVRLDMRDVGARNEACDLAARIVTLAIA